MCSKESLTRRCVLVKKVPEGLNYQCIYNIPGVEKFQRQYELSNGNGGERLIVLFRSQEDAEKSLKEGHVAIDSDGWKFDLPVRSCPDRIIPDEWIDKSTKPDLSFINTMEECVSAISIGLKEEDGNKNSKVEKEKVEEKAEDLESQDIYIPKFVIPPITSHKSIVTQVTEFPSGKNSREEIKETETLINKYSHVTLDSNEQTLNPPDAGSPNSIIPDKLVENTQARPNDAGPGHTYDMNSQNQHNILIQPEPSSGMKNLKHEDSKMPPGFMMGPQSQYYPRRNAFPQISMPLIPQLSVQKILDPPTGDKIPVSEPELPSSSTEREKESSMSWMEKKQIRIPRRRRCFCDTSEERGPEEKETFEEREKESSMSWMEKKQIRIPRRRRCFCDTSEERGPEEKETVEEMTIEKKKDVWNVTGDKVKIASSDVKSAEEILKEPNFPVKMAEFETDLPPGEIKFFVMKGDVTKLQVDVMVNEASKDLGHRRGLALAISRAGGDSIKKESKAYIRSNGTVPEGDAITAKPGNLPCQMLVHAVGLLRRFGNNGEEVKLRKVILKCLELTDRNNYSSIAIPALGAGNSGYPTDRSVCTIINSIQIYFKSKEDKFSNIKKIYFCDIEEKIVMAFIECFRRNFGNRIEEIYGEKDLDIGNRKCRELSVEVRQGDITQEKTDAIVSCISESLNFNVGAVSKAILRAAGDRIVTECRRKAQSFSSEEYVVTSGGNMDCKYIIHVKGQRSAEGWERMVTKALAHADKTGCRSISFPALGTGVVDIDPAEISLCMFRAISKYHPLNLQTVRVIVFQSQILPVFEFTLQSFSYVPLQQTKDDFTGKTRGFHVGLPTSWTTMKNNQTLVEITLNHWDNEYQEVMSKFKATSMREVSISEIRRVQNPYLYQQYAAKRKEIEVKNGKNPQKWLWHGTYPETVDKIINNGFNRGYCGRNGTIYGAGVYFAVRASYSSGYCRLDSNGLKHMFFVQVATGDHCMGNSSMNVLPHKPGTGSHVTYDSACDNLSNPEMYVIFHDTQAYPAYHIIFR